MQCTRRAIPEHTRAERGSGLVLAVLVLSLSLAVIAVLVVTARTVEARARAQYAADAAALGAVVDGEDEAARLATANGAVIVHIAMGDDEAIVEVVVDGVRARARAQRPEIIALPPSDLPR